MKWLERCLALGLCVGVTLSLASGCNSLIGADAPTLVDSFGGAAGADAGAGCLLNSECPNNQFCVFRVCSKQCAEDKDCLLGRCLSTSDGSVCVVPSAATCTTNGDCPAGSQCLRSACRTACDQASDCLSDQSCVSDACVGTDASHDPLMPLGGEGGKGGEGGEGGHGGGAGGSTNDGSGESTGTNGGEGGFATAGGAAGSGGMAGEAGATPQCTVGDPACDNLTPLSCQDGQMKASGANCLYACLNGACEGECKLGDTACDGLTYEVCGSDHQWQKTTCGSVCDAKQGCIGSCVLNSLQCNGTTELDVCTAGSYTRQQTCTGGECALVSGVAHCALCGDSDKLCPPGCTDATDVDCPKEPGESCTASANCRVGVCGAEGVCCDSSCTDGCSSCKLTGKAGICTALDFSKSSDKNNCGGCHTACSTKNVTASCTQGVCGGTCVSGFRSCNAASANDGCETNVTNDPNNCGGCSVVCKYGECLNSVCAFSKVGPGPDVDSLRYGTAGGAVVAAMQLNTINAGKIAALGVLATVGGLNAATNVYLALYTDGGGFPSALVAETAQLTTVDAATVGPTEGAISPAVSFATGSYWLVIMSSDQLRLHTVVQTSMTTWFENTAAVTFGKLTGALPGTAQSQAHPAAIGYAIVVP